MLLPKRWICFKNLEFAAVVFIQIYLKLSVFLFAEKYTIL